MVSLQLIPPFGGESVHHLLVEKHNQLPLVYDSITIKVNLSISLFHSFISDKYTIKYNFNCTDL